MRLLLGCLLASTLAASASAAVITYHFDINVAQEVPVPNIIPGTTPVGHGMVELNTDTNALSWVIDYFDLSGNIVSPGAHIHGSAGPGATAGVFVFLAGGTGAPLPQPATGQLVGSTTITETQEGWITSGLAYVNIHTQRNPSGEIRGQIVPEPGTLGLLAVGALALLRRR